MSVPAVPATSANAFCPVFFRCHCWATSGSASVASEKPRVQLTATLLTSALELPLPFAIVQLCPVGGAKTLTLYAPPSATGAAKVNPPLALTAWSATPLLRRTSPVPVSPLTVPPTRKPAVQTTVTLVTGAETVPEPFVTVHASAGADGKPRTVTLYVAPLATCEAKVNEPFAVTLRFPPPLSCRTRPEPERPLTVPPTVNICEDTITAPSPQPARAAAASAAAASPNRMAFTFVADMFVAPRCFNCTTPRVKGLFPVDPFRARSCPEWTCLKADC